jgi:polyhydroxyalkanoate synthesis regulator phasin
MTDLKKFSVPDFFKDTLQSAMEPLGKVEARVKETVEKLTNGGLNQGEIKKVFDEILRRVRDARTEVEKGLTTGVQRTLAALNLPSRDEIRKLEAKVNKLSKDVDALKGAKGPKTAKKKA